MRLQPSICARQNARIAPRSLVLSLPKPRPSLNQQKPWSSNIGDAVTTTIVQAMDTYPNFPVLA